ncbi:MAG TPA: KTSC domain-containing protein [Candidatus Acidoferrum sp.]
MSFLDSEEDNGGGEGENGDPLVVRYSPASSCIANLTYHRDTNELFMTFTDGRNYVIEDFPEIELERWVNSPSVGGYFNTFVRGNY